MKIFYLIMTTFIIIGLAYIYLELLYMALLCPREEDKPRYRLRGVTSGWMFFLGGFVGLHFLLLRIAVGRVPMVFLMLFGCVIITASELGGGMLFNKVMRLNLWTYDSYRFNFLGQIELFHSIGWFAMTPLSLWAVDSIYKMFNNDFLTIHTFFYYYVRIITDFIRG